MPTLLKLREQHSLSSNNYYSYSERIPKWEFCEMYAGSNDTDIQIIRQLYKAGEQIEKIRRYAIEDNLYLIGTRIIIVYKNLSEYEVCSRGLDVAQFLAEKVIKDVEVSEGLSLVQDYDFINSNIVFNKYSIDIRKFSHICKRIQSIDKETVIQFEDGDEYLIKYTGDKCFIDNTYIPVQDVMIFEFLADTKTNIANIQEFYVNDVAFVETDDYILRIDDTDVNYIALTEDIVEVMDFITERKNKDSQSSYISEEKETKRKAKKQDKIKAKENNNTLKSKDTAIHKGKDKLRGKSSEFIESLKKKLLFIVKKPED